ncbi:hypothetical protein K457DRAFT_902226 [Linnemannia elongata AG-77]|uniref:Uncharacterized protein n=1 Tax=Linnemannia elongata AG-77 TaxID=1314771 RepID=A0A197KAV3_9FUNG|nr:hypothetical protein K457DRAFT_902226 [Linnemannia elongata AG-77]
MWPSDDWTADALAPRNFTPLAHGESDEQLSGKTLTYSNCFCSPAFGRSASACLGSKVVLTCAHEPPSSSLDCSIFTKDMLGSTDFESWVSSLATQVTPGCSSYLSGNNDSSDEVASLSLNRWSNAARRPFLPRPERLLWMYATLRVSCVSCNEELEDEAYGVAAGPDPDPAPMSPCIYLSET